MKPKSLKGKGRETLTSKVVKLELGGNAEQLASTQQSVPFKKGTGKSLSPTRNTATGRCKYFAKNSGAALVLTASSMKTSSLSLRTSPVAAGAGIRAAANLKVSFDEL